MDIPPRSPSDERRILKAKEQRRKRVRRAARELEDAHGLNGVYERIEYLSQRVGKWSELTMHPLWDEVLDRLIKRESCYRIEKWLRPRLSPGEPLYDVKTPTLVRRLQRFRNALPDEVFVPILEIDRKHYHETRLDVMHEFAGMIRYQKTRVDRFAEAEKEFPIPVEQQRRELETLTEMLRQYWQAEVGLGLRPGAPNQMALTQINVDTTVVHNDRMVELGEVGQAMALTMQNSPNAIPEVMGLLDRLRRGETIEGSAVEIVDER